MTRDHGAGTTTVGGPGLRTVEQWLLDRGRTLNKEPFERVDPDLDLIDSGLIDSLRLVEFVFLLGETTGAPVAVDELVLDEIRTLRRISRRYFTSGDAAITTGGD